MLSDYPAITSCMPRHPPPCLLFPMLGRISNSLPQKVKPSNLTSNTLESNTYLMKVTVKGQITIPIAMRERFGLRPGTEVEFVATEGTLQMKPRKRSRKKASAFDHWLAKAAGSAQKGMTTDEIMAITRGED